MIKLGDSVDKLIHKIDNLNDFSQQTSGITSIFKEYSYKDWQKISQYVDAQSQYQVKYVITYDIDYAFMNMFDKNSGRSIEVYTQFDSYENEMLIYSDEPVDCICQFASKTYIDDNTNNSLFLHNITIELPKQTSNYDDKYIQLNKTSILPTFGDKTIFTFISKIRLSLNYKCRNSRKEMYIDYADMLTDINGLRPSVASGFIEIEYYYDRYNYESMTDRYEKVIKHVSSVTITPTEMILGLVGGDSYVNKSGFNNNNLLNLKLNSGKETIYSFENDFLQNNAIYVNDEVTEI